MTYRSCGILSALFFLLFSIQPARGQLSVDTLLTIGDDERATAEYLFGYIDRLERAPDGRLFVSDTQLDYVRVYDKNGRFVRQIGQRGEGPGEFIRPRVQLLTDAGGLYVRDREQHRVTVFDVTDYQTKDIYPFGYHRQEPPAMLPGDWPAIMQLYATASGNIIMLGISAETRARSDNRSENLFIEFDSSLTAVKSRFGSYDLVDRRSPFVRAQAPFQPGHALVDTAGKVWFAPGPYDGTLYLFEPSGHAWSGPVAVHGMSTDGPLFEEVDPDGEVDQERFMSIMTIGEPSRVGRLLRQSAGLVERVDGQVLHFVYHIQDGRGWLTMERFTREGRLDGVFTIAEDLPDRPIPAVEVQGIDEEGNLYTIDRTGEAPVIRVLSVSLPE